MKKLSVSLDESVHRALKLKSVQECRSMQDIASEALAGLVNEANPGLNSKKMPDVEKLISDFGIDLSGMKKDQRQKLARLLNLFFGIVGDLTEQRAELLKEAQLAAFE